MLKHLFGAACLWITSAMAYEGQLIEGDHILLTSHSPDALFAINREGDVVWRSQQGLKHPQQVSTTETGEIFCATIDGARLLARDGSPIWNYHVPAGAENATALTLEKGKYLIAHEGKGELVTLDHNGAAIRTTRVSPLKSKTHGQFRYVVKGGRNLLVPMTNAGVFREIAPDTHEVIWEIRNLPTITSALRREDGGTFIAYRNALASFDKRRNHEWTLKFSEDLGLAKAVPATGITLLPGGNLLVATWHKHKDLPDLFEFDPNLKKIVHSWYLDGYDKVAGIAYLPNGHPFSEENF
ncbi:MAG: PQQ-binding-like beta-propeller repeat protein [Opitutales bacterium]